MCIDASLLMLTRHSRMGSSSRLRMLEYRPYLEAAGFRVSVSSFFDDEYLHRLAVGTRMRFSDAASGFLRRLSGVIAARHYDVVWIEKELFPFLPGAFESVLRTLETNYVVDYDDATFHRYDLNNSRIVRWLLRKKLHPLIRSARLVTVGNLYLADYTRRIGAREVVVIPTVVDLAKYPRVRKRKHDEFRIGWIGSPSTTKYLSLVHVPLETLAAEMPLRLVTIGAGTLPDIHVPIEKHAWSEETEARLLSDLDVGIMPLTDSPWERGKCGFKLLQYMACQLPVIASPVGVNPAIIGDDCGFLANANEDWVKALRDLRLDSNLRRSMAQAGRHRVERDYSLQGTAPHVVQAMRGVLKPVGKGNRLGACGNV